MLNIAISIMLSIAVSGGLYAAGVDVLWASLASVAAFALCYILLTRLVMKKIGELMEVSQRDLQAGRTEKAVKTLESGFKYGRWQFFIKPQINAQIGTIYYLKRDFAKAFDYLEKGFVRHWMAMAMLGICYMKRQKQGKMIDTFEKATSATKKEPLLWNIYAYCLDRVGERQKAIDVLEKGLKKAGSDERLEASLKALQDGKRMKMKGYGDLWYQFHLEKPGAVIKKQTKAMQGRRKIVRR